MFYINLNLYFFVDEHLIHVIEFILQYFIDFSDILFGYFGFLHVFFLFIENGSVVLIQFNYLVIES
jgi:hypothetical protein